MRRLGRLRTLLAVLGTASVHSLTGTRDGGEDVLVIEGPQHGSRNFNDCTGGERRCKGENIKRVFVTCKAAIGVCARDARGSHDGRGAVATLVPGTVAFNGAISACG
mmetsp:Transcript_24535/g.77144  ORF Transcript_24535/g.77144 Transcript_24535/m.77144 type:complete len:107 (+) Transcript_24535:146-466(+)